MYFHHLTVSIWRAFPSRDKTWQTGRAKNHNKRANPCNPFWYLLINDPTVLFITGKHIAGFTQKKASAWQPQWTRDEALCFLRSPNNEIVVYKDGGFSAVDKRLSIAKLESFSASPGNVGANKAYPGLFIYILWKIFNMNK